MRDLLNPDGVVYWLEDLIPGYRGKPLPHAYRRVNLGHDGAAYLRRDGLSVIFSGATEQDGKRWLHVSCAYKDHLPSWLDLREVKDVFLGPDVYAYQVLPPRANYVNIHKFTLHLFSCLDGRQLPEFTRGGPTL